MLGCPCKKQETTINIFFPILNCLFCKTISLWTWKKSIKQILLGFTWRHGSHVGVLLTKEFWLFLLFGTPTWPLWLLSFVFLEIVWNPRIQAHFTSKTSRFIMSASVTLHSKATVNSRPDCCFSLIFIKILQFLLGWFVGLSGYQVIFTSTPPDIHFPFARRIVKYIFDCAR